MQHSVALNCITNSIKNQQTNVGNLRKCLRYSIKFPLGTGMKCNYTLIAQWVIAYHKLKANSARCG